MFNDAFVRTAATSQFLTSQLGHFFVYSFRRPEMSFERAMLIVSTDVDVGSPDLGIINEGKRDRDINSFLSEYQIGRIEEIAIPLILKVFDDFEIPITLAIRGQLTEIDSHVMEILLASQIKHDIGAHGYYHRIFPQLTDHEAEEELVKISAGMKKYNILPETFIFPRNRVAHLDLLEKHKYICYRGVGGGSLGDRMFIEKNGELHNVHPSLFIGDQYTNLFLLKGMLDISIKKNLPFHIWFHFWNFGDNAKIVSWNIRRLLLPFLSHAKEKQKEGLLEFETMLSATRKARKLDLASAR
jgi:hypothetical protein